MADESLVVRYQRQPGDCSTLVSLRLVGWRVGPNKSPLSISGDRFPADEYVDVVEAFRGAVKSTAAKSKVITADQNYSEPHSCHIPSYDALRFIFRRGVWKRELFGTFQKGHPLTVHGHQERGTE